ncbi:pyridoxamine 5'-phosphate oxidase [Christiangramia forsetii]|uniref:Pyridoxine/pyridoxamine 5'-phosphate oxidase n=2 Tax=Christiangramia forsetii TaxID=411153 RepID=PDXH_CHRFK|nr:pyridoxamine 5'-phosphate oxidase [Christiangramia forsetii]A0M2G0.1 RecName: Full=Pyridoxine/pyridoxamine 5'-phosphate oxidase; AltName: Full=PNP/PMP oxidase; Short=PNPOx; AltName: Full=Pyridoxal 5'-phosphate synthase [Christiangramia forsetii KT0803]GGG39198.1 pyridoxine/pyridoxamine 5'-phosphate oxidase [Christiangramia forsetii]CAL66805.1 pyridoxamine 5'-phosphate oxidase [Christiangramia forsetii KT0803]
MEKDLANYRRSYEKGELLERDIPDDPYILFESWFNLADNSKNVEEANAMSISTVGKDLMPKTRVVLLKSFDPDGLYFYTNYDSVKGRDLDENPKCCISFFWPSLEKQIIIQGEVVKVSSKKSEEYFHSRPRGSQLGAHASNQSSVIPSREYLEERLTKLEQKYLKKEIPKPKEWGGFLFKPVAFEFWQGRASRLHDRILFTKKDDNWKIERLAP